MPEATTYPHGEALTVPFREGGNRRD